MDSTTTTDTQAPGPAPASAVSESFTPAPLPVVSQPQDDEEDDDPEVIIQKAEAEIHALLKQEARARFWGRIQAVLCASMILGGFLGVLWAALTYPPAIVTVVPLERSARLTTTALNLPLRQLVPVTLSRAASTLTSGTGHQEATRSQGSVTFYNGAFVPYTVRAGTVFTGTDGIQIVTDATLSGDVLVKNLTTFTGGQDARSFPAVAASDLTRLSATLHTALAQAMPQAFRLAPGDSVSLMHCVFTATPDRHVGDEAHTVTIQARETCAAVAYNQDMLRQHAAQVFVAQTAPGKQYELLGNVQATVVSAVPFTVRLSGSWVYVLSRAQEQRFAELIAGDTPAQARAALLRTGEIAQATIPQHTLPQAGYIRFVVLIGEEQ